MLTSIIVHVLYYTANVLWIGNVMDLGALTQAYH